jgi:hypothetical protein
MEKYTTQSLNGNVRDHTISTESSMVIINIDQKPENPVVPPTLTKYYKCDEKSLDALKNNYLWAAHPQSFNDPIDCNKRLWDNRYFSTEENFQFPKDIENELSKLSKEDQPLLRKMLRDRSGFCYFYLAEMGIICLNELLYDSKKDEISKNEAKNKDLFWAHYADSHKGFSIDFDTQVLIQSFQDSQKTFKLKYSTNPFKVEYVDFLEEFELNGKLKFNDNWRAAALRWATVKKSEWNYENEWRFVFFGIPRTYEPIKCPHEERKRKYNPTAIKKVILGIVFFDGEFVNVVSDNFIEYDLSKESDCHKKEMISYLIEKQDLPLYWNFMNEETLELQEFKIRLSGIGWNKVGIEIFFDNE